MKTDCFILFIVESILLGTKVLVPFLFFIDLFKIERLKINYALWVRTVSCVFLFGSTVYLVEMIGFFFVEYFSGAEYVQYSFTNRAVGPYWFAFWLMTLSFPILPQLLWIKRFQKMIVASALIVAIYFAGYIVDSVVFKVRFLHDVSIAKYFFQSCVYLIIFAGFYFLLSRRHAIDKN